MKKNYWKNIWLKLRYSSIARVIFDAIARLGIRIAPYYLFREGLFNGAIPELERCSEEYTLGFLGPGDMKCIADLPERKYPEEKLHARLQEGNKCFGIKYHGSLAAFTWCNFRTCTLTYGNISARNLQEDEVYLFDSYTVIAYRGKGIAPYIRYQLYKELARVGRHRLYSISDAFNKPAIKFKKKLNARFIELRLFVSLFKRWRHVFLVKKYD
jgi:hypothetical protein